MRWGECVVVWVREGHHHERAGAPFKRFGCPELEAVYPPVSAALPLPRFVFLKRGAELNRRVESHHSQWQWHQSHPI